MHWILLPNSNIWAILCLFFYWLPFSLTLNPIYLFLYISSDFTFNAACCIQYIIEIWVLLPFSKEFWLMHLEVQLLAAHFGVTFCYCISMESPRYFTGPSNMVRLNLWTVSSANFVWRFLIFLWIFFLKRRLYSTLPT